MNLDTADDDGGSRLGDRGAVRLHGIGGVDTGGSRDRDDLTDRWRSHGFAGFWALPGR